METLPGETGEIPFGMPDEAALARLAAEAVGPPGGAYGPVAPGDLPPGLGSSPVGSPGVPGAPGQAALAAPVHPPGLGGVAPATTDLSSVRPGGAPDHATLAQLAAEPYGPGSPLVTPPAVGLPAGFPDEATLLRMAAAFFSPPAFSEPSLSGPSLSGPPGGLPALPPTGPGPVPTGGLPVGGTGGVPTGGIPAGGATAVPSGALPPGTVPVEAPSEASRLRPAAPSARPSTGGGSLDALAAEARTAQDPGGHVPVGHAPGPGMSVPANHSVAGGHPDSAARMADRHAGGAQASAAPVAAPPAPPVPDLPGLDTATEAVPVSVPSSPYYFLAEVAPAYYFAGDPLSGGAAAPADVPSGRRPFDVHAVRADFPILSELVNGRRLVWLDNAATTQKPQAVIDRLAHFYAHENSNIHRAAHELAKRSTDAYEGARDKVARFLGAGDSAEIVFVRGTTEGINLVAAAWGRRHVGEGDEIVISHLEHHANIVPWQQLVRETGAVLKVIPVDDDGQILLDDYTRLITDRTKLVAVTQVSNALGTVVPVAKVIEAAHQVGAKVLVDGAQSVPHLHVNVRELDADFFVFSGHKLFAPTGIGALYGKADILESMTPYQTGGHMIREVTLERSVFQDPPTRFEAGTGNIADAVGLGAALDYLERIGFDAAARYEHGLLAYGTERLRSVPGLTLVGTAPDKASVLSFTLAGFRPPDVAEALNRDGIAVRAGHHCAQPILRRFGLDATVRPSLAFYNTVEEVDVLVDSLHRLVADAGGARFR